MAPNSDSTAMQTLGGSRDDSSNWVPATPMRAWILLIVPDLRGPAPVIVDVWGMKQWVGTHSLHPPPPPTNKKRRIFIK